MQIQEGRLKKTFLQAGKALMDLFLSHVVCLAWPFGLCAQVACVNAPLFIQRLTKAALQDIPPT